MVFVGFGFLMAFLQRYGFSSVGFTFLLAAFALQWSTLIQGFLHSMHGGRIRVGVQRWAVVGSRLLPSPGLAGRPLPGRESQPRPCPSVGSQTCGGCPRGLPAPSAAAHPATPGPFSKPLLTQGLLGAWTASWERRGSGHSWFRIWSSCPLWASHATSQNLAETAFLGHERGPREPFPPTREGPRCRCSRPAGPDLGLRGPLCRPLPRFCPVSPAWSTRTSVRGLCSSPSAPSWAGLGLLSCCSWPCWRPYCSGSMSLCSSASWG